VKRVNLAAHYAIFSALLDPNIFPSTLLSKTLSLGSKQQQTEAVCSSLHSLFTSGPADNVLIYAWFVYLQISLADLTASGDMLLS